MTAARDDVAAAALVAGFTSHPRACWLDGGPTRSVLGLQPDLEIEDDSLDRLDEVEAIWREEPQKPWIGWISYDLGADELLGRPHSRGRLPGLVMRRYPAPVRSSAIMPVAGPTVSSWPFQPLEPAISAEEYRAKIARAQQYIRAGDTYQVNLSQRFHAGWSNRQGSLASRAAAAYVDLRRRSPATMGALLAVDERHYILSNSPETLFEVAFGREGEADTARSFPIKGTRPRHADPRRDAAAGAELLASEKDRAEHVMIVDLVRNDLGRLALPGSVHAQAVPNLVSLATVHHLVSEVKCELAANWTLRGLLGALFPGASITGAPKRRTVEIIDELEAEPRGIYCGAIVLLEPQGVWASIPIRTGLLDTAGLTLRSGGGIVVDSDPELERLETVAKARAFDRAFVDAVETA